MKKRGYNIYRIYKKAHIIKNLSEKALHNIYKVTHNSTTLTIERFFKGVWWISGWCSSVPSALKLNVLNLMLIVVNNG